MMQEMPQSDGMLLFKGIAFASIRTQCVLFGFMPPTKAGSGPFLVRRFYLFPFFFLFRMVRGQTGPRLVCSIRLPLVPAGSVGFVLGDRRSLFRGTKSLEREDGGWSWPGWFSSTFNFCEVFNTSSNLLVREFFVCFSREALAEVFHFS